MQLERVHHGECKCLPELNLYFVQAPTVIRHLEVRMGRVAVRIVSLVCIVIFILHLFACLFHSVAMWNESTISWVEASGIVNKNSQVDRYEVPFRNCAYLAEYLLIVRTSRWTNNSAISNLSSP